MLKVLRRRGFTLAAMGPRLGDTRYGFIRVEGANPAAMGPSPGRLGDGPARKQDPIFCDRAAMGPSLGRLGDPRRPSTSTGRPSIRRNGAEPRKARRPGVGPGAPVPRSKPQWGRASEGSETQTTRARPHRDPRRRNGAEPRKARRPSTRSAASPAQTAGRNGAELRKARRRIPQPRLRVGGRAAAMGPSLGRLGDPP